MKTGTRPGIMVGTSENMFLQLKAWRDEDPRNVTKGRDRPDTDMQITYINDIVYKLPIALGSRNAGTAAKAHLSLRFCYMDLKV